MAAVIGALRVTLGADIGSFETGLKKASNSLSSFANNVSTIAGGIQLSKIIDKAVEAIGKLAMAIPHATDAMDKMGKQAQILGTTVEGLSRLSIASKLADVETEALGRSVIQLSKRLVDMKNDGTDPAGRALGALGVNAKQFRDLNLEQKIGLLADRFSTFRDGVDKTAAAAALFGSRVGPQLIPLLNEGSKGIQHATEMAQKLNLVMSKESAEAAQKFQDNMKLVSLGFQGIANAVAERLLPAMVVFSERMVNLMVRFFEWSGLAKNLGKDIEDLRKQMKLPSEEEAQKAKQLRDRLFDLQMQTRELRGDFAAFPAGFMQAAAAMDLVKKNAETLPITFGALSKSGQQLAADMLTFRSAQITQENLLPLDAYTKKMAELQLVYRTTTMDAETFARASVKVAESFGLGWQQIGTSIAGTAGAISNLTGTFAKENKAMGIASKAFGIGQAIINTHIAITKALATLPPPASYAAVAFAVAQGAASVAAIASQSFAKGGSFIVPGGVSGIDNMMMPMGLASGERVTVETPEQQRGREVNVHVTGRNFGFDNIRDMFAAINDGIGDGYKINLVRA